MSECKFIAPVRSRNRVDRKKEKDKRSETVFVVVVARLLAPPVPEIGGVPVGLV